MRSPHIFIWEFQINTTFSTTHGHHLFSGIILNNERMQVMMRTYSWTFSKCNKKALTNEYFLLINAFVFRISNFQKLI